MEEQAGSRVHRTISAITRHIRANDLAPGDRLPSEAHFATELEVSRTVVREAFRSLAAMRLIELSAGKRAVVARMDHTAMAPVIEHGVSTEQISVQQIYDVRRAVETRTAALAALRRTDAEAAKLIDIARRMKKCPDIPEKIMELDIAFHLIVAEASRNPIFHLIVGGFENVTRETWPIGWRSRTDEAERLLILDLHLDIARAIEAGDPAAAAEAMTRHFDESVRALIAAGLG